MMNVNVKHIVEIAGGLVIGSLASDAVTEVVKITKVMIKKHKENKGGE